MLCEEPLSLLVMVKLGYVPLVEMPAPDVRTTVWSGDELVITPVAEL
jgi:hypothetical protein